MNENAIRLRTESFENELTHELVEGVTIIIDGQLKQLFDELMQRDAHYDSYQTLVFELLKNGINTVLE